MKKITLAISGMTCSACSNGLEKYLNKQNGVFNAAVNLVMANATVEYDENILDKEKIEKFVSEAGFKSEGEFKEIKIETRNKIEKYNFIFFTILAIILMYVAMGHMVGLPTLIWFNPTSCPSIYVITLMILVLPFLIYGFDILRNGYKNLIHKTPNMDTLVGIGVLTSLLYSLYNTFRIFKGDIHLVHQLYFESCAIVIYFVKLGRYIDGISKDKTKEAIQKLVKITPNKATLKVKGELKEVTLDQIHKRDIVVSKAGEKIAVDGEVVEGSGYVDESFITGESKPVKKEVGDKVIAGSLNYNGYIEYKAEKIGRESTVSEIVRLVVEASNTKAPIAKVADKVASYFVPVVILIAIVTGIFYAVFFRDFGEALKTFVTILVVACPCSLGLATPLAIIVSEGKCATNGILVKKSEILENAQKVNAVVFDKTGTLTYGKLKIAKVFNYTKKDEKKLMQIVGSIEAKSNHPIAKAFTDYLEENKIKALKVEDVENLSGLGLTAKVNGKKYLLGNSKLLEKYNIENKYEKDETSLKKNGNSIIYFATEKEVNMLIGVNDVVRKEAKEVIKKLNEMNVETVMLTGDNKIAAEKIAKEIGITKVISNVLPKEKTDLINKLKEENKFVMMCGDGINDSPALAKADIGVSVNSGTDIAMDSSDVILTKNNLKSIVNLIGISKKTVRNIKQNLFWAFFYNSLMIPVAMGIFKPIGISIDPMMASFAMVLSSLTVILNTLRIKK